MEFQYYGANCVKITTKKSVVVVDDNLDELGLKTPLKANDIAIYTTAHGDPAIPTKIVFDQPGEFEAANLSVRGIAARAHMDEDTAKTATIFKLTAEDTKVLVTGHIYPELSDDQLEVIGMIDVMIVPVGGNGYTLDGIGALKLIKKVEPKIVIPVHYADKAVKYPLPQQELKDVLQALGMEPQETTAKLKLKGTDLLEGSRLIVLERQ